MSELVVQAQTRKANIKTPSIKAYKSSEILGIVYNKKENIPITLDRHDFVKVYNNLKSNSVIKLIIDNKNEHQVILKEKTKSLRTDELLHVDFYKILTKQELKIHVPINYIGRPIGVSHGGVIRKFTDQLLIKCTSETIPEKIDIDISKMDISDFLYLNDITPSDKYQFLESPEKSIVAITNTSKSRSEEDKENTTKSTDKKEEVKEEKKAGR